MHRRFALLVAAVAALVLAACGGSDDAAAPTTAASAVVTSDVPAYAMVYGNPARVRGYACECGVRMILDSGRHTCGACDRSYEWTPAEGVR